MVNFDFGNRLHPVFGRVFGSVQSPSKRGLDPTCAVQTKAFAKGPLLHREFDDFGRKCLIYKDALVIVGAVDSLNRGMVIHGPQI